MKTGSCLCGRVRLRLHGAPLRVGLCHCLDCRKAHGGPFGAFVIVPASSLELTGNDGQPLSPDALGFFEARPGYRRHFCAACGSPVMGTTPDSDERELHLGSFDTPSTWTPTYELWTVRREDWLGELPTVREHFLRNRGDPPAA